MYLTFGLMHKMSPMASIMKLVHHVIVNQDFCIYLISC